MRRAAALLLAGALLAGSGCTGGVGGTYRNIEELQIVEALGFDIDNGRVLASAATGRDASGREALRASGDGVDVTSALRQMRGLAAGGDLFFDSTGHILLGEAAAEDAGRFLGYVERSVELRLDTPLLVARGGTARSLVLAAGGTEGDAPSILSALEDRVLRSGAGFVPGCAEIAAALERSGAALALAVRTERSTAGDYDTAVPAGFAVLRGGALVGYLDAGVSLGAGLLLSRAGRAELYVSGAEIRLISCSCGIEPVWDGEKLRALRFSLSVSGSLTESAAGANLSQEAARAELEAAFAAECSRLAELCLAASQALEADFLGLGAQLERREPRRWREIAGSWDALLPQLELHVEAEATLLRSYGYDDPPTRGKGG